MGEAATGRMAENCRDLSDVAKGGDGAKSEAAIEFSPGYAGRARRPAGGARDRTFGTLTS
jgi:hypothetical protein